MRIRNLLGLGSKPDQDVNAEGTASMQDFSKNLKKDKIPAHVQDSCCGSCGGGSHGNKKELPDENA
jgi:hypothetical protein